jgi:hypothetical protein
MPKVSPHPGYIAGALIAGGLLLAAWPASGRAQVPPAPASVRDQTASTLRARIGPPDEQTIQAYIRAGATETKGHVLTEPEWALVEAAIVDLPASYRTVLERRLARLSFIDAPSSLGTALTRTIEGPGGDSMFDITIRAEVLEASLSDFLTQKEAMLFSPDGSGYSVRVEAGQASALTYILLHETSHVVDRALNVTKDNPFKTVWADYRTLAPTYSADPIAHTAYRREPKLALSQSPSLYKALARSPFVSLYATASAGEDFAELMAWSELSRRFETPLKIQVLDGRGDAVVSVEPLKSPTVRSRLEAAQAAFARARAVHLDKI